MVYQVEKKVHIYLYGFHIHATQYTQHKVQRPFTEEKGDTNNHEASAHLCKGNPERIKELNEIVAYKETVGTGLKERENEQIMEITGW